MRKLYPKLIITFVIFCVLFVSVAEAISWNHNFSAALKKAKAQGKLILVDFYTDWCKWCKVMDKNTYTNGEVNSLAEDFVCVKVDGDKHRNLVIKYKVRAYPTTLFLNEKGVEIDRIRGYVKPEPFAQKMKSILARYPATTKKKDTSGESRFELTGIIFSPEAPRAIINNSIVTIGGTVSGAKVVKITEYEVILSHQGKEIILKLE